MTSFNQLFKNLRYSVCVKTSLKCKKKNKFFETGQQFY